MVKICPNCNKEFNDMGKFCTDCGINLIKVFNTKIMETLVSLYKLDEFVHFKVDINNLNDSLFDEKGLFVVYDSFIKFENKFFIQEFPFRIIKSFKLVNELYELELNNNHVIKFEFDGEGLDEFYVNLINDKLNNPAVMVQNNFSTSSQPISQNQMLNPQNNQYNQQNQMYNQPMVINQKSAAFAFILNLLFLGAGYAYVNKWGRFLLTFFIIWPILIFIGFFTFMIPTFIFWIYVVLNTNTLVNKYNNGEVY